MGSRAIAIKEAPFRKTPLTGLALASLLLLVVFGASIAYGAASIDLSTVFRALVAFNGTSAQETIRNIRLPRAVIALCVGASLAVAGALMQALTKNPLAAPGIMGVNAGASLLVVAATLFLASSSQALYIWVSLIGAAGAGILVYYLSSVGRQGMTPLKLIIAGATISTLLSSLTQGLLVMRESTLDEVRFWLAGSVANRNFSLFLSLLPYLLLGLLIAFLLGKQITTLSLGDDVARGLGQRIGLVKALTAIAIILLAGGSVAIAGPVGFVGLVIPHIARALVGVNYRWILPYSAVLGAILLLGADIFARWVVRPGEVPVGAVTAIIGAPVLIWLVRQKVRRQ
ncbi:iron ABC transporter permease [Ktedonosporobacter rubrisoli]|uniref:Iron ABC transporter permease n=1 Tax=Ktedonosporobacter rubrisoli TaxID=2509675 RepID=A0A4P6JSI2_KTERU|nr:iron ABC transporter permease [Ktedonosporobacter rubrisoli]QBD78364.1 iron ABC transporter permease [Ktedonosporobacter rubrisoli]